MSPSPVSRRALLGGTAAASLGIAVVGSLDPVARPVSAVARPTRAAAGYGPLVPDPAGRLSLPPGFDYQVVAVSGVTRLDDGGEPTPDDVDGMAVFAAAAGWTLVVNHEVDGSEQHHVPLRDGLVFDPGAGGGTTTVDVDPSFRRLREYVSVAGTLNNCAGGVTPWATWLTCEETEQRALPGRYEQDHGWVFEVSPRPAENPGRSPVPLRFLGRFAHEAVAVDPTTAAVYETEDASGPHGLVYRWTPPPGFRGGSGALHALALSAGGERAGRLAAMRCSDAGRHVRDLSQATEPGTRYAVTWSEVPDRLATSTSTRVQLADDQVTRSRKLEGAWWGDGGAYVVASFARADDGSAREHDGQVWFYDPRTSTLTLRTIFRVNRDPEHDGSFDGPDNITVSPHGGVVVAEDGRGLQHLVGITDAGSAYPLARNELPGSGELTGPTFTPDGRVLFAGVQSPGHVFAVSGPWRSPGRRRRRVRWA